MLTAAAIILMLSKLTGSYIKFTELANAIREDRMDGYVVSVKQLILPAIAIALVIALFYLGYMIGKRSSDAATHTMRSVDTSKELEIISTQNEQIKQLQNVSDSLELQLTSLRKRSRPKRILEEVDRNNLSMSADGGDSFVYNFYLQRADRHFNQEGNTADIYPDWE